MSIISRTNQRESLFHCGGFLSWQIRMELLVIDWVKEEAKMAKIIRYLFMFIVNQSIFKSIVRYFFGQNNSAEGVIPDDEF